MKKSNIHVSSMVVKAHGKHEALETAKYANDRYYESKFSYFLAEQLGFREWLIVLAHNEDEAKLGKDTFYEKHGDEYGHANTH